MTATRPALRVIPGGHAGVTLTLGGVEYDGMGTSLALELLERGREQGRDQDASLHAAGGVLALRAARALLAGDTHASAYAKLAVALHEEAVTVGVQTAWDEANGSCEEADPL